MRVITGSLGGRIFEAPKSNKVHPMSDRVKQSLFNSLGDLSDKRILDGFAGSGALGIEAHSRGAEFVQMVEKDHEAYKTILHNLESLNIDRDQVKATRANVASWSENNPNEKFDILLLDPPYDKLQLSTISTLVRHLSKNGLMVLSHSGRETSPTVNGVVVVDNRVYGDAALSNYRYDTKH